MPEILWSRTAQEDILKLDKAVAKRIVEKIEAASKNQDHYFEQLSNARERKLRIGDYRVIVQLFRGGKTILIERIGHRKNIYKR